MNSSVFWDLSYGIYVITAWDKDRPTGCIANCAMQITAEPATIAVSMNHDNYTNRCIAETGRFAITILGEGVAPTVIGTFGYRNGKELDKFASIPYEIHDNMPIVSAGVSFITCEVINKMETETHTVYLGKVVEGDKLSEDKPMTYAYYHNVIKGKSPKNAPTYIPVSKESK